MKNVYRSIGLIGLASLIGSCGGDGPVAPPPPTTASVTMSATTGTLVPGANFQLSATARDQSGNALSRTLAWSSSDAAKATVSSSGMVSGVAPGSVTITAAVDGKSAASAVRVLDGGVVTTGGGTLTVLSGAVQIDVPSGAVPSATNISVVPSTAYATDPRVVKETPFDFGPSGTQFAKPVSLKIKYAAANLPQGTEEAALQLYLSTTTGWQAVEGSLVDLTAKTVAADVSHFSVYAILTPLPVAAVTIRSPPNKPPLVVGDTAQLTATLTDAQGGTLTHRAVTWATSNAAIASVTSSGLVTGVAPGTATVSATAGGVISSLAVTVTPVPIAGVAVTLLPQAVEVGQTSQASAVITDAGGNILTGRAVSWSSDNSGVATVSANGEVTAIAPGTAQITATSEGKTGSAAIAVSAVPVSSVTVTPPSASVTAGATQQLAADAKDAHGNVLTGRVVTWSSSDPAVATVSQAGVVAAVSVGTATITATSEGKNGTASITVTPIPVAALTLSASTTPVVLGQTQELTAAPKDGSGNTLVGRTVNWVSSNTAVLTVSAASTVSSSTGATVIVTATGLGTAIITASSEAAPNAATPVITVNPVPVATVSVSPASPTLVLGLTPTQQLTATLKDVNNTVLTGRTVTWSSSKPTAATVDANGFVTAVAVGSTTITATSEGKSGTASITVSAASVASVSVSLAQTSITAVGTSQATATTFDSNGNSLAGRTVTWSSDNTAIATVSAQGVVSGVGAGTANIVATSEGKTGSAPITITPAPVATITLNPPSVTVVSGAAQQLTATLEDAHHNVLTGRTIAWSSDKTAVATVSAAGLVTAIATGTANIVATSEGQIGSALLTVVQVPVASLTLSASITPMVLGQTQPLTAVPKDGSGNILSGRTVNWVSSDPAVLSVSSPTSVSSGSGATITLTAVGLGTAIITATSESAPGVSTPVITVSAIPVATVTVTPASAALALGVNSTQQLTATLKDANSNVLTGRIVTWTSSNTAAATVNATGFVTAVGGGTSTITAASEGQAGTASITVTVPVWTVTVNPSSATLTVGLTHQLTATTKDVNGSVLTGRSVTWSSTDPTLASVSSTGLVTAVGSGTAVITATSEGKSGTSSITVTAIPVASVSVSLSGSTIQVGQTTQATATTYDSNNTVLTGRVVTWSTGDAAVATVSSTGLVTATGVGSTAIIATSEGKTGNVTITVVAAPVASVSVNPGTASVIAGATQQLSAETRDANNVLLTGRLVSWSSNNTAVATVNTSGLVTAVAVGGATITAASEGKSGTSSITVLPVPVASVNVSLSPNSITAVGTSQATATTLDSHGGILTGRAVTWSTGNPAIATVNGQGVVTAVAVGTVSIIATSEGQTGSATLTVTQAPVASVTVSPSSATVVQGSTEQVSVTLTDAHGTVLSRPVTWSSSSDAIASVSQGGLVTANAVGTATITATSEGQTGTASVTVSAVPVASVTVTLGASTITDAQTTQATAIVRDANGNVLVGRTITWTSDNTAVATVSVNGLVTPVAAGSAQIHASTGGQIGGAALTVISRVAAVIVTPSSANIVIGSTRQLAAETRDANNSVLTGRSITWSSDAPSIASVSTNGLVTSHALGGATITATSEGVSGTSAISVVPVPVNLVTVSLAATTISVGQTTQATATTRDANGNILTGRSITWSSGNTSLATVSSAGLVTAVGPGSVQIIAMSEGTTGSSTLTIDPAPVATVTLSAPATPVVVGATQVLTAQAKDAGGNALTGRTVNWTSSNTSVLTVSAASSVSSASGATITLTAVGTGTATVTATSESAPSATTPPITVNPAPVATVNVALSPTSITAVGTSQGTATTLDANGNTLTGRAVVWSSSNTAAATVDAQGVVTAVAVGTSSITATSEGKSGSATLTVTPAPVATVTVSLAASSINAVQTTQATATLLDAKGRTLSGRAVNWSSDNTSVATVDQTTGLVTAVASGAANIIATSETVTGSASLNVTAAAVATVAVNPPTANLVIGTTPTQQLSAVLSDANGHILSGRLVTWTSSNTAAATVDANGLVTAVAAGTSTVTATSEGKSGTSSITVSLAPVTSVTVTAPTTPMILGVTQLLTATTKDANSKVLTGRTVTWVSSNTAVLTVSSSGNPATVTAMGLGTATITATSESVSSNPTPTITVIPPPVASVTLSFPTTAMVVGGTQTLTAQPRDGTGHILSGRTVNWVSSDPTVLAVSAPSSVSSSTGATVTLTAVAAGTATVTATSETAPSATTPVIPVRPALASGPLRVSSVNPRYFADPTGRVVYLTGSEYWKTIQDNGPSNPPPTFDYSGFLDFLQNHNHNFTRLYMWEQARWSAETSLSHWFSPTPYMRTGPGTAADGGPKFDVSQINPDYLARVRQRVIDAGARGIYVSVMLFNGWSVEDKEGTGGGNPWVAHPFNAANNINGIDGDPNADASGAETQTLAIPAVTDLQDTYVKAVIDAVNDLDNVIYEISNESDQSSDAWQYHMINLIRSYEATKPKQHPIGMSVPYPTVPQGTNNDVLNSSADWVSMNGNADAPAIADGAKVSLWDTDHLCGICGDAAWAWKSFTRGHNPLLMDGYDGSSGVGDPAYNPNDPKWEQIRTNMGYARSLALRMDLAHDTPRGDLVSTGYALAGTDYLVFLPTGGSVNVDLSAVGGTRTVEWFNPSTGQTTAGGTVTGGSSVNNFTAPFGGMAVLFIHP